MVEFIATLLCIWIICWWLFPNKEEKQRRRIVRLENKLNLAITGVPYPTDQMRTTLDARKLIYVKETEDGYLLRIKSPRHRAKLSIITSAKDEEFSSHWSSLPLFVSIEDIGSAKVTCAEDCIFVPLAKTGPVKHRQEIARLYTKGEKMEAYLAKKKAEEERRKAEEERRYQEEKLEREKREREREEERERYLKQQEEERKQREEWWEREGKYEAQRKREEEIKKEIADKLKEKQRRQELEKIVRQELIEKGELFGDQAKRPPIPKEVADAVYSRDGGKCVYCGSTENLQFDHIIPFSKGGATSVENLQLLCQKCNLEKSNKIG